MKYTVTVQCLSPVLIGSGEGFGALIDTDVVFDDVGLPYIPAKRIKGCLLDAAKDVQEMFDLADIPMQLEIPRTFGTFGEKQAAPVYFWNLTLAEYQQQHDWLQYYLHLSQYQRLLSRERILATFTDFRQQTKIEDGVANDHSLRTIRVLKKGLCFTGDMEIEGAADSHVMTLILACANFRQMGTKRNRGLGEVRCVLCDENGKELQIPNEVKDACKR